MGHSSQWDIQRLLKQIHPDTRLDALSKSFLCDLISVLSEKLCKGTVLLTKKRGKKTISSKEIRDAAMIVLDEGLGVHLHHYLKFISAKPNERAKSILIFSITKLIAL